MSSRQNVYKFKHDLSTGFSKINVQSSHSTTNRKKRTRAGCGKTSFRQTVWETTRHVDTEKLVKKKRFQKCRNHTVQVGHACAQIAKASGKRYTVI